MKFRFPNDAGAVVRSFIGGSPVQNPNVRSIENSFQDPSCHGDFGSPFLRFLGAVLNVCDDISHPHLF